MFQFWRPRQLSACGRYVRTDTTEIILDCDQIRVRDKASGEYVYQAASSPSDREWKLDTAMMMCMEPSSGGVVSTGTGDGSSDAMVRAGKLLNRDIGDVVVTDNNAHQECNHLDAQLPLPHSITWSDCSSSAQW